MPKIVLPTVFSFVTSLPIRITDVNYGGHLANDAVLSLAHEGRLRYLQQHGYSEHNAAGVGLMMVDCAIVYKNQGFYGDVIALHIAAADCTHCRFTLYYRLMNEATQQDIAHIATGMVCYDYQAQKVQRMPAALKEMLVG